MSFANKLPTTVGLLKEIDKFLRRHQMSDATFGRAAVGNAKFLPRLRDGLERGTGDIKLERVHQIYAYMEEYREEAAE